MVWVLKKTIWVIKMRASIGQVLIIVSKFVCINHSCSPTRLKSSLGRVLLDALNAVGVAAVWQQHRHFGFLTELFFAEGTLYFF
jgi:hypothetical protein